ncbi:universal stress protein [Desulfuromonas versatilis]|uniref:Universal stress protein n=1 Tax=Desulfuromonas versatilis TaxID=2802975 RepID=A0ABM8HXT6_9BACT|nr:universal stress protein [Desulfuromonas versatilis]BCR05613.1 universal stress protein [Desulfuromonas versatilis]
MTKINQVLAATDFSEPARVAMKRAISICQGHGAHLEAVHVIEELPPAELLSLERSQEISRHQLLEELEKTGSGGVEGNCRVETGKVFVSIIRSAREIPADLIVVGAHHNPSFRDHFLGTTAEKLVRKSPIPVLVTKQPPKSPYKRILVPIDFSDASMDALNMALALAPQASVELLHVYSFWGEGRLSMAAYGKDVLEQYRQEAQKMAKSSMKKFVEENDIALPPFSQHLRQGHAASEIIKFAKELDVELIVMGTTGRSGLRQVLVGSVTEHVLRAGPCDILTVRSPEFQFELP